MSNTVAGGAVEASTGVQSVDRALTILEILARSGESGVTEIAAALAVHKSTAFRLVTTLEQHGLVEQVEGRGKYRLGVGLLRLAGATSARLDVVQEARPLCKQLAAATGETVNLATLSGNSALYLDQVAGSSALQSHNWVGQHIPLHATSNGKVLMAWLEDKELSDLLGRLPAYTGQTVTNKAALRKQLAQVREDGYAVAVDELEVGLTAIAAPVHNAHGDVICSISVSGPTFRLHASRCDDVVPLVVDAADELSHRLGWGHR
jgi:DNA-binding IclR family transcriptional regulator